MQTVAIEQVQTKILAILVLQTRKKTQYIVSDQFIQECRWPVALLLLSGSLAFG